MNNENRDLIYIVSCAINKTAPLPEKIKSIDLDRLLIAASYQKMVPLVAFELEKIGIRDSRFTDEWHRAAYIIHMQDEERQNVLADLEEAGVWYMPLKGAIIKELYPAYGVRPMSDNDILIDKERAADVKRIMENRSFRTVHFGYGHQDDYMKPPFLHFEMHRVLFDSSLIVLHEYYKDLKNRLIKDEGNGYGYHFSEEDFYIYMIAHMYKHYYWEGVGLRALFDIYVFLNQKQRTMNRHYLDGELQRAGIDNFEKKIRNLALTVFSEGTTDNLSKKEKKMLDTIISFGDYGQKKESQYTGIIPTCKYIARRLFVPIDVVKVSYPMAYKHKILLPLLPVFRIIKRRHNVKRELKRFMIENDSWL